MAVPPNAVKALQDAASDVHDAKMLLEAATRRRKLLEQQVREAIQAEAKARTVFNSKRRALRSLAEVPA